MKKFLVIGNPIEHSLSPKLHNYWIKKHNINAIYEKKKLIENDLKNIIMDLRKKKLSGINVTIPFKNSVIGHLDQLSLEAKNTQSVNTIYSFNDKLIGHNTDIIGFELSLKNIKFNFNSKKVLILGAGGVVPSIIFALKKMKVSQIIVTNRTKYKAENLKNLFQNLNTIEWGQVPDFDIIINATSLGLNKHDEINLDLSGLDNNKFFYDVIYNPQETNFLKIGKESGNIVENGKMMFIYQASAAFKIWHGIHPEVDDKVIDLLSE
tara:strand:+ start:6549 stop:7343 length:795 start_codon:yes stop_codon:yes gene_type:complete